MAHRLSPYEQALKQQARARVEKQLTCPACGRENKPGAMVIEIDDRDDAWCSCGYCFAVRVE